MILVKAWSRDLNVTYWKLKEHAGVVILRPTWRVALTRLLITFMLALVSSGWVGVDYELRQMVGRRRIDPEQLAEMERRAVEEGDRLRRMGQEQQAREAEASMRAFTANIVQEREEEIARVQAGQLPWRILLLALAGLGYLLALIAPLSVLWQRIRIERERDDLAVRKIGLWTRTRRVSLDAARRPEVGTRAQMAPEGANVVMSYAWGVRLADPEREILFWVKATKEQWQTPAEVQRLVDAIGRVAGK